MGICLVGRTLLSFRRAKGRAGNSLICSSLIRSFRSNQMRDCERFAQIAQEKWATVSESFICSFHSNQMNDCERFAQIAHEKCATVSECSGCSRQMSNREQIAQVAHDKWATVSDSLRSLMINERMSNLLKKFDWNCIFWYVFVCLKKRAICLFPLFSWAICSGCPPKMSAHEQIAQVAHQK